MFRDVVPRPERLAFSYDRDEQSDDATSPESQRSALFISIEEAGEVLVPVEVDEAGHLLDGFRRVAIAHALGIEEIPVEVIKGWRGEEQKRSYIREVNATGRVLGLHDRREMAKRLLGEDEQQFRANEVKHRLSYGLVAAQTGLSQHTVEELEKAHYYLRYRARCEGEQRLRGDGRLRATNPIPPENRLDEQDAWRRGLPDTNRKRSLAGLLEVAKERRQQLEQLPDSLDRQEQQALLEDALAILTPGILVLDQEREENKARREAEEKATTERRARREAEAEMVRRQRYAEGFLGDLYLTPVEGEPVSISIVALINLPDELDRVVSIVTEGGQVSYRSGVSLDPAGDLRYTEELQSPESLRRLIKEASESESIVSGDRSWPLPALASGAVLRALIDLCEEGQEVLLEVRIRDRVAYREELESEQLLSLHRELNRRKDEQRVVSGKVHEEKPGTRMKGLQEQREAPEPEESTVAESVRRITGLPSIGLPYDIAIWRDDFEEAQSRPITELILEHFAPILDSNCSEEALEDAANVHGGTIRALKARELNKLTIPDLDRLSVWLRVPREGPVSAAAR